MPPPDGLACKKKMKDPLAPMTDPETLTAPCEG